MSGLEVLGAAAAAAQFVDVGWKVVISLSRLISDLKQATKKVKVAARKLEQLVRHVQLMQEDVQMLALSDATTQSKRFSDGHLDTITALLRECADEAAALDSLLKQLTPGQHERAIQRSWKAIVGVKKETEILERCAQLDRLKMSLNLWFSHGSLVLLEKQILSTRSIQNSAEATVKGVELLNTKVSPIQSQLSMMEDRFNQVQSLLIQTNVIVSSIDSKFQSAQRPDNKPFAPEHVHRTNSETTPGTTTPEIIMDSSSKLAQQLYLQLVSKPQVLQEVYTLLADTEFKLKQAQYQPWVYKTSPLHPFRQCNCKASSFATEVLSSSFRLFLNTRSEHQPHCPFHKRFQGSISLGAHASLFPLIGKALQVTFAAKFGAGGFSLSPTLNVTNVIQRSASPAFSLFDTAYPRFRTKIYLTKTKERAIRTSQIIHHDLVRFYYWKWDIAGIEKYLEFIIAQLEYLFLSGQASCYDQDEYGRTLLHEITLLAIALEHLQTRFYDLLSEVVIMLVNGGVRRDAMAPYTYCGYKIIGDATSMALTSYSDTSNLELRINCFKIDQILFRNNCEVGYGSSPSVMIKPYSWGKYIFPRRPELAAVFGYGPLTLAVLQRSGSEVHRLLRRGFYPDGDFHLSEWHPNENVGFEVEVDYLPPLEFARGWPTGMKLLLDSGADPYLAIHNAIREKDLASISMHLDHGCPLYPKPEYISPSSYLLHKFAMPLLYYSTLFCREDNFSDLILQHLIKRRQCLRSLAKSTLSREEQVHLGVNIEPLLDSAAVPVYEALLQKGIDVPASLRPYGPKTVYHHTWLTTGLAEKLYRVGFHSIDAINKRGYTPILLSCLSVLSRPSSISKCGGMLQWFLDKGVMPVYDIRGTPRTALHLPALDKRSDLETITRFGEQNFKLMARLIDACDPMATDSCNCYCSSYGCAPIHMKWKRCDRIENQDSRDWEGRQKESDRLAKLRGLSITTQEGYFAELCRLEIFERLGMAHTCCDYEKNHPGDDPVNYEYRMKERISDEDREELQAEDAELYTQLSALMGVYRTLRIQHSGPFLDFWQAWWAIVDDTLLENDVHIVDLEEDEFKLHELVLYKSAQASEGLTTEDPADILRDSLFSHLQG